MAKKVKRSNLTPVSQVNSAATEWINRLERAERQARLASLEFDVDSG